MKLIHSSALLLLVTMAIPASANVRRLWESCSQNTDCGLNAVCANRSIHRGNACWCKLGYISNCHHYSACPDCIPEAPCNNYNDCNWDSCRRTTQCLANKCQCAEFTEPTWDQAYCRPYIGKPCHNLYWTDSGCDVSGECKAGLCQCPNGTWVHPNYPSRCTSAAIELSMHKILIAIILFVFLISK